MTVQEGTALIGAAGTLVVFVSHAAIAWWRIGAMSKDIDRLWEHLEESDKKLDTLTTESAKSEVEQDSIVRRLGTLEDRRTDR